VPDLDFDLTAARDARGTCRLTLRGELDLATAARLEQALSEAGDDVLLDLRGLTFMDSTGVRGLLEAAERDGPRLRIIAPVSGDVRGTIEETGIASLLPLVGPDGEAEEPPHP
jgi:anti-anti-sigma factor